MVESRFCMNIAQATIQRHQPIGATEAASFRPFDAGHDRRYRGGPPGESAPPAARGARPGSTAANHPLDAPVGHQPQQRHQQIQRAGDPAVDEREQDAERIKQRRELSLAVTADGLRQRRFRALAADDSRIGGISSETPYRAVGTAAKSFSPSNSS